MAPFVQTDVKWWLGGYDISADFNAVALVYGAELKDDTTYGNSTRTVKGGLRTVRLEGEGYWDSPVDSRLHATVGVADTVVSIGPVDGTEGSPSFFAKYTTGEYGPISSGTVGDMLAFRVSADGRGGEGLVSGTIMVNRSSVVASSNSGTALQLGAVAAGESVYAALHVLAASGTLDVTVNSDDGVGWGSPTTRVTFAQATAVSSEYASAAGAIADDYWRVDFTVSGDFDFVVCVGIK